MSELAIRPLDQPLTVATTSAKQAVKPDPNNRPPTGRTKQALDLMVHEGLTDNEAAVKVGITITAIRMAIQKRGVRAYLNEQREVSRARVCARNIHRLAEIRDKADNMPAIQAIKLLEQVDDADAGAAGRVQRAPGVTVIVVSQAPTREISTAYTDIRALDETADEAKR
jgi:hypothetical protein